MNRRVHNIVKISVNGYHLFSALSYLKFNNCKFHSALAPQDECLVASVDRRLVFTISPIRTDLLRHRRHIQCTVQAMQVTLVCCQLCQQEGQHPLTGQRAANFRLLANQ